MSRLYDLDQKPLHELLEWAQSASPTLLIPDLQRPYVWTPRQVILLVDSMLRGWPFGTLLLWKLREEGEGSIKMVPSRPFWTVVDRSSPLAEGNRPAPANPPAAFRMVLDGQQRLQSLILAFGGDAWGMKLLDRDWCIDTNKPLPRGNYAGKHWTKGVLYVDLKELIKELERVGSPDPQKMDFQRILVWAAATEADLSTTPRAATYNYPLERVQEHPRRYVRLSRLWQLGSDLNLRYDDNIIVALKAMTEIGDLADEGVLKALSRAVLMLRDIRNNKIGYLEIQPLEDANMARELYADAVVNIFARLNSGGRILTRQEITLAWIKTRWDDSKAGGKGASDAFDTLREALQDKKLSLTADDIVSLAGHIWTIYDNLAGGRMLAAADLVNPERIVPMAAFLNARWPSVSVHIEWVASRLDDFGFYHLKHYKSMNSLYLLIAWSYLLISWKQLHSQSVAGDDAVERAASSLFEKYGIPWMILTQWAGHWAQGSDQFVTATLQHLNNVWSLVQRCADLQKAAQTAEDAMAGLLGTCVQGAKEYVRSLEVYNRNQVAGAYYVPLWLWERLDRDRLVAAKKWRRYQRSSPDELQVDHLIPVGILEPLSEAFVSKVEHFEVDSERANSAMTINSLGNCALLSRGFNGAKNAKPLRKWLDTTSEFASDPDAVERWAKEMYLSSPFLEVDYSFLSWRIVEKAIADRAERIQRDLNNFIDMPVALHTALKNIGGDHFRSLT